MNYQMVACYGDSLTFGARTYGCYPMYLSEILGGRTRYAWSVLNRGVNGHTARDLWFVVNDRVQMEPNRHAACVLIGTNDAKQGTPVDLFRLYYLQVLQTLQIHGWTVIAAEIPLIVSEGRLPYTRTAEEHRNALNAVIREAANAKSIPLVNLGLTADDLSDGVHWNEDGNRRAASRFADAILAL
jgi:lysophospholipase L1-like esterase